MLSVVDSSVVIITGGSSGIGAAAARELARRGATVAITGRSEQTARIASEIGCDHYIVDFESFADVRHLAATLLEKYPRINVLANNVGGIINERRVTEDGHEATLQINHLSPFLLTSLLQERLSASHAAVINTSSRVHLQGKIDFSDLEHARSYAPYQAYGNVKLMNILHATELNRRYGNEIAAVSFHPGVVATGFAREGNAMLRLAYQTWFKLFMLTPEQGADTLVWLANSRPRIDWEPGGYYVKRKPAPRSAQAADAEIARKLWDETVALIGEV